MDRITRDETTINTVFNRMFSVICPATGNWPISTYLPPPVCSQVDILPNRVISTPAKCKKTKKVITHCPHPDRKHYAKNMCNNCYHKYGRANTAWDCEHSHRKLYAKGKCQNCYLRSYLKLKKDSRNMV